MSPFYKVDKDIFRIIYSVGAQPSLSTLLYFNIVNDIVLTLSIILYVNSTAVKRIPTLWRMELRSLVSLG